MKLGIVVLQLIHLISGSYFDHANHDGIQIGSKYFYFPSPAGVTPDKQNFEDASASCVDAGGQLAYPSDDDENEAIKEYLELHFGGDLNKVQTGLGAWFGIIKENRKAEFMYEDGTLATYLPFDMFGSRLVGKFAICASMTYGYKFDQDTQAYSQELMWDESFCRRSKMPFCMVDLTDNCSPMGVSLSSEVIDYDCESYSACDAGVLTNFTCDVGTTFSNDTMECVDATLNPACDVDECLLMPVVCPDNTANCTNTIGGHNCTCEEGYEFNDNEEPFNFTLWTCDDVDECAEGIDNCNDVSTCINTIGSFWCHCDQGFWINGTDGGECVDYDECVDGAYYDLNGYPVQHRGDPDNTTADDWEYIAACDENASCENEDGYFNCTCNDGFEMNITTSVCHDIDECALGIDECHDDAVCDNTFGDYNCTCVDGYFGDGFECFDSDECGHEAHENTNFTDHAFGVNNCSVFAACTNFAGFYDCDCEDGFYGDGFECADGDECGNGTIGTAGVSAFGMPIEDSYYGSEECDQNATCANVEGSYNCTCVTGYRGDGFKCSEVNECREGLDNCHIDARCKNTEGSFECICEDGFYGNGVNCTDSDECGYGIAAAIDVFGIMDNLYNTSECHEFAECTNEIGGYNCTCDDGFEGDGWVCEDIDECEEGLDDCSDEAECINTPGNYSCECMEGFFGDGFNCSDIDECAENAITSVGDIFDWGYGNNTCDENAECSNQIGFYNCSCLDGYWGNGENCTNIDECDEGIDECDENAECTDTDGSYMCECNEGFFGGGFICEDNNECGDKTIVEFTDDGVNYTDTMYDSHDCDAMATCFNMPGSFNCTCDDGYYGNGTHCADIDECGTESITLTGGIWDTGYESHSCSDNATCTNFEGDYNCTCQFGYHGDGETCIDLDECAPELFTCDGVSCDVMNSEQDSFLICDDNADCTNTDGSYECACAAGFESNNTDDSAFVDNCVDIDECVEMIDMCDDNATCNNTIGNYTCECHDGYDGDGFECSDIDECALMIDDCHFDANCTNTDGGFECDCFDGFSGNGTHCEDIDECVDDSLNECHEFADCNNNHGDYNCTCFDGYRDESNGTGFACVEIDECAEEIDECHDMAECTNIDGSYNCSCTIGFEGDGFGIDDGCLDVDECANAGMRALLLATCDENASCNNTYGSYECACDEGYEGDGTDGNCTDIDECADDSWNDCHEFASCTNGIGNYTCDCDVGFDGDGFDCLDIDECDDGSHTCSEFAECYNHPGNYSCGCFDGYEDISPDSDGTNCTEIDECTLMTDDCSTNANCTNTDGSFECDCHTGYDGDGVTCDNIDECVDETHNCHANATCTDNDGSFECACLDGFSGDGVTSCADQDECADPALNDCDQDAEGTCENTDGGFECGCIDGYELNPTGNNNNCKDIHECYAETDLCVDEVDGGLCANTIGSYDCSCTAGFVGTGRTDDDGCTDHDECDAGEDNCAADATCTNTPGSFECACNDGFTGNGTSCADIDECADEHACDPLATCANTPGSFSCSCIDGYFEDSSSGICVDIDECALAIDNCDAASSATCTNTEGSFSCSCPENFGGAGTTDDPCTDTLGECDPFVADGYELVDGTCDQTENAECGTACAADYHTLADGEAVTINWRCVCTGDRSDVANLDCNYEIVNSVPKDGATCVKCDDLDKTTWFGAATNTLKVEGPNGMLVESRVQQSAVAGDWSTYTVFLVLPGGWTDVRIFTWIYDVVDIHLETDSSSTIVTLAQNANSPILTQGFWNDFFVGFDNIPTDDMSTALDFRIGVMPGTPTDVSCVVDALPVTPPESAQRKHHRQQKWAKLSKKEREAERQKRQKKRAGKTHFIAA